MNLSSALGAIKNLVGQGDLENALEQLLAQLDGHPEYAEFAQVLRVNKADFFQIKSQILRGTISTDAARLANNQIADNILRVIQRIESGKTTLQDPAPVQGPAHHPKAWRYYVAGGVVTLAAALIIWQFFGKKEAECPSFGKAIQQRVMVLPLKKIDAKNDVKREFDISDDLNTLIAKDPILAGKAEADVNEAYNIDENYPNPSEAGSIAENCDVQMIVWGKIRDSKDTVEVRYKLLNPVSKKTSAGKDPHLNKLLALSSEGVWVQDVKTISKLLYLVLANQSGNPEFAANVLRHMSLPGSVQSVDLANAPTDTTTMLLLADVYRSNGKKDSAMMVYDRILAYYPNNVTALRLRGSLNFEDGKFWASARDLQSLEPDPAKVQNEVLPIRMEAYLKCGWPEKARQDLEQIKKDSLASPEWIKLKERVIGDSLKAYEERMALSQRLLAKSPNDDKTKLQLAKARNALGDPESATKIAEDVRKRKPKSREAIETIIEASTQKGDIRKAVETVQEAERQGINTKTIRFKPTVRPLVLDTMRSGQ